MAVAYVNSGLATPIFTGTSISTASIDVTGANLIVGFASVRENASTHDGATFDGNAMTQIGVSTVASGISIAAYRYAPAGNGVLTANFSSAVSTVAHLGYLIVSGADTSDPIMDHDFGDQPFGATLDITAVTGDSDALCAAWAHIRATIDASLTSDQTMRQQGEESTFGSTRALATAAGSSSVAMGFQWTGGSELAHGMAVMIRAAAAAAGQPTSKRWGGVPHMGGRKRFGSGSGGGAWGMRKSGLVVPLKEAA